MTAERTAVVTGGNRGVGFWIIRGIAIRERHIRIVMACRDTQAGAKALGELRKLGVDNQIDIELLDVSKLESIEAFAKRMEVICPDGVDILVNNAGVSLKGKYGKAAAGPTMAVNYYGVRDVFNATLPHLNRNARVVNVSSMVALVSLCRMTAKTRDQFVDPEITMEKLDVLCDRFIRAAEEGTLKEEGHVDWSYGMSKAVVCVLTELQQRVATEKDVIVNCACPGFCKTDMGGRWLPPKSAEQGASTILALCATPADDAPDPRGKFFQEGFEIDWRAPLSMTLACKIVWRQIAASWQQPVENAPPRETSNT